MDSTIIKEPGDTGSQWRVLYSLRVPDWQCDCFRLISAKGAGKGESLKHFSIKRGDCLLADRGFSYLVGIEHLHRHGGSVIVRLNDQSTPLELAAGSPVALLDWLKHIDKPGQVGSLRVWLPAAKGTQQRIPARHSAVRKSIEAARWRCANSSNAPRANKTHCAKRPSITAHGSSFSPRWTRTS